MRISTRHNSRSRSRRRGVLILAELLFVFPVLMMFFLGIVEFYMLVAVKVDLLASARGAVRLAASEGYNNKPQVAVDAEATARSLLGTGRLSKSAHVTVTWSQDLPPDQTAGAPDWVEVEVDVKARRVMPDLLGWLGFSIGNKNLVGAMRMKQE